jgi:hypothetical protein
MSYSAFVTRDRMYPYLRNSVGGSISVDKWLALAASDQTLALDPNDIHAAIWTGHSLPFRFLRGMH